MQISPPKNLKPEPHTKPRPKHPDRWEAVEAASTAISGGVPALMQIPEGRLKECRMKV